MSSIEVSLTPAQRQICIGQQLDRETPLYNMGMLYRIQGSLDVRQFEDAWQSTVRLCDALRTRLQMVNGEAHQIDCHEDIPLLHVDFTNTHHSVDTAKIWVQHELEQPIALDGSLVSSVLVKLGERDWIWLCKQHHIITDATSFAAIWEQLCCYYNQSTQQKRRHITSPYHEYVELLQVQDRAPPDDARSSARHQAKAYWQEKILPVSSVYYGRRLSLTCTGATRHEDFFDSERARTLEQILALPQVRSISLHLSRFQLLLTVMFAYLYRVSGNSELAVATTAPNRSNTKFAKTPGLFVELLPLTIEIEPGETFASLFNKVKTEVFAFLKHSVPGAGAWVSIKHVSAVLNYVPLTMESLEDLQVTTSWLHPGHMDRQHAIRLHATDWNNSGELSLAFDFNDGCFSAAQKSNAKSHWLALFDALSNNLDQPIDAVDIVKGDFIPQKRKTHPVRTLVDDIETVANQWPDRTAVSDEVVTLSYRALLVNTDRLHETLLHLGAGNGKRVGVLLPRSAQVPVALLAILKSGATYIPVDSNTPTSRIKTIFMDAMVETVVTDSTLVALLPDGLTAIRLDNPGRPHGSTTDKDKQACNKALDGSSTDVSKMSPAYILYTSGTTGKPKGVMVSRSALYNYCSWAVEYYAGKQALTFPFFTPLGFDLTLTSLFVPLLCGGQIKVYPPTSTTVDDSLSRVIEDNSVDIVKLTPAHLSMLQHRDMGQSSITQLIVGGEDLKCELAQKVHAAFSGKVTIHNEYGPTEATVGCIVHKFDPSNDTVGSVPIGKPVAGMSALVLNNAMHLQPEGVAGELYISGPSLADGYWQRDDLTEINFVSVLPETGSRHYRTGDLAHINTSGDLVYLGRDDDQHKIRGARIELAEIEAAALHQKGIDSCIAIALDLGAVNFREEESFCTRCGLSSHYPDAYLNDSGICSLCLSYENYREQVEHYFKPDSELETIAFSLRKQNRGHYHCMVLLSGGKDSTYALARVVDLGLSVLAYTLDNGYLSTEAKANIKRVCSVLNVDHEFGTTPAMKDIFADSLDRYSNVCNGCFKTIYTLAMQRADEMDISCIFTGLSRGQFFETKLTEELFSNPVIEIKSIDQTILSARKAYHRTQDAVSRLLDTRPFATDDIFDRVQIVDFYRYCSVSLEEMLDYLRERLPWVRPRDTGRSTNCLINDVGIHVHKLERGFHNYALPYSWDVRLGHKQRDDALEELQDKIDLEQVEKIMDELDYSCKQPAESTDKRVVLYYTSDTGTSAATLQHLLKSVLPDWMLPSRYVQLVSLPLSENGKVLKSALPIPVASRDMEGIPYVAPSTELEKILSLVWCEQLKLDKIGINDNFFSLGGDSLSAIRIAARIIDRGYTLNTSTIFTYQTIANIAAHHALEESFDSPGTTSNITNNENQADNGTRRFESLKSGQLETLSRLLERTDTDNRGD